MLATTHRTFVSFDPWRDREDTERDQATQFQGVQPSADGGTRLISPGPNRRYSVQSQATGRGKTARAYGADT